MADDRMPLTVGQAAERLGVTVRTLHHWDAEGVACPSERSGTGYRLYTGADLERLERVVIYRELGLGLDAVRALLDDPTVDAVAALREQNAQLEARIRHLRDLHGSVQRMIEAHERGILMPPEQQKRVFGTGWDPSWPAQARARWGDTPQWRQYAERAASRSPSEWSGLSQESRELDDALARAVREGTLPGNPRANDLVERHRALLSQYFPLTRQMQVCLGRLYESDPGFAGHYDSQQPGLASWFHESIDANARAHGVDPDTAEWE
ncbi:MerR family transcriptional regulator [Kocuria varians]|uniref:MerR family transcriptional regulator n=1 Tax=Kocuria varians TaxID=1272 RepID=A0A4Y4D3A5_KOCVA|nr:MerR family transcriptional regulator [Kocuria varians]GEC98842.1 MerR family transcriptional regulator [Kocuria varians]